MAAIWPTLSRIKTPLTIICTVCNARDTWSRQKACNILGPDATPAVARNGLRCNVCGARGRHGKIAIDALI